LKFNLKNNSKMTAYVWAISPYGDTSGSGIGGCGVPLWF
jgi:hypothetical protein